MDVFLPELARLGFSGVQNFPTVVLIDKESMFRRNLEETGSLSMREDLTVPHAQGAGAAGVYTPGCGPNA